MSSAISENNSTGDPHLVKTDTIDFKSKRFFIIHFKEFTSKGGLVLLLVVVTLARTKYLYCPFCTSYYFTYIFHMIVI